MRLIPNSKFPCVCRYFIFRCLETMFHLILIVVWSIYIPSALPGHHDSRIRVPRIAHVHKVDCWTYRFSQSATFSFIEKLRSPAREPSSLGNRLRMKLGRVGPNREKWRQAFALTRPHKCAHLGAVQCSDDQVYYAKVKALLVRILLRHLFLLFFNLLKNGRHELQC